MIRQRAELPIVAFSIGVYRALLAAYPAKFQEEYGSHMLQVFRDCCLGALRQRGTNGMVSLWAVTLLDLIQSVISEHGHKEIQMKKEMKPEDIRLAGQALMWGALAFVLGVAAVMIGGNKLWGISTVLITLLSMPLVMVGMLALRNRYGEKAGGFASSLLLAGVILGPLTTFIGLIGLSFPTQPNSHLGGVLFISGPAVPLACLALFGVVALFKRPLPRWNAAPLIGGLEYPVLILALVFSALRTGIWDDGGGLSIPVVVAMAVCMIQGVALAALGYVLKSDAPEATTALA